MIQMLRLILELHVLPLLLHPFSPLMVTIAVSRSQVTPISAHGSCVLTGAAKYIAITKASKYRMLFIVANFL